jgi:FlaA1/EpsC-like NDP-sugar epimerase
MDPECRICLNVGRCEVCGQVARPVAEEPQYALQKTVFLVIAAVANMSTLYVVLWMFFSHQLHNWILVAVLVWLVTVTICKVTFYMLQFTDNNLHPRAVPWSVWAASCSTVALISVAAFVGGSYENVSPTRSVSTTGTALAF